MPNCDEHTYCTADFSSNIETILLTDIQNGENTRVFTRPCTLKFENCSSKRFLINIDIFQVAFMLKIISLCCVTYAIPSDTPATRVCVVFTSGLSFFMKKDIRNSVTNYAICIERHNKKQKEGMISEEVPLRTW